MASACSGVTIRPTARVTSPLAAFTLAAKRHLVPRPQRNLDVGHGAAARHAHVVEAGRLERGGERHRIVRP